MLAQRITDLRADIARGEVAYEQIEDALRLVAQGAAADALASALLNTQRHLDSLTGELRGVEWAAGQIADGIEVTL